MIVFVNQLDEIEGGAVNGEELARRRCLDWIKPVGGVNTRSLFAGWAEWLGLKASYCSFTDKYAAKQRKQMKLCFIQLGVREKVTMQSCYELNTLVRVRQPEESCEYGLNDPAHTKM